MNTLKGVFTLSLFFHSIWIEGVKLVDKLKLILLQGIDAEGLT